MALAGTFSDAWRTNQKVGRPRKGVFEDLVDERRQRGDLGWVLRTRRFVPQPTFCSLPREPTEYSSAGAAASTASTSRSPADIKRQVLSSDRLTYGLREISLETGRPMAELMSEAGAILDEMSHCLSMFAVRSFGYAVAKVMKRIYRGVYVNTEGISQLRKACSEYPVVLMPMHRSYADFLLLSLICFDYDLPLPAIASAMDFMGMQFIGSVLRNCGAFFIRRSFATDRVYWLTFVEYVKSHVRDGLHPVEFFIEGTRSRTGKSLYPKTGMLGAILESWFMCEVPDVYLVPVSVSYDRILEQKLYAYELLGVPKPKESTSGLLKARALLEEDFGSVHFYFDEPISLRKFAADYGGVDRSVHSLAPKVKAQLTEAEIRMLKAVAHHAISRHCLNAVVSPFCLIAGLLLADGRAGRPVPLTALAADLDWLRLRLSDIGGLANLDWPAQPGSQSTPEAVISEQCRLHSDLIQLVKDRDVESVALVCAPDEDLEARAALRLQLCSYRNHIMCHLIEVAATDAAITTAAASSANNSTIGSAETIFNTLRHLLHREFPTIADLEKLPTSIISTGGPDSLRLRQFARACLRPALIGCQLVCSALLNQPELVAAGSERVVALAAQKLAFNKLASVNSQGDNGSLWDFWEAVSLDLLVNSVHGLHRLRILVKQQPATDGKAGGRCDFGALSKLRDLLDILIGQQTECGSSEQPARSKL